MKRKAGFSLIELLIVLTILAIVLSVGYATLRPLALRSRLEQAAAEVAASLARARSFAQRENVSASWTRVDESTYRLMLDSQTIERDLPTGLRFTSPPAGTVVTYTAPYGEVAATPVRIRIEGHGYGIEVRVIGVTGKIIRTNVEKLP